MGKKVYGLKLQDGSEIIKVKGLSSKADLTFDALKSLLHMNSSLVLNQDKSFRNFSDSTINLIKIDDDAVITIRKDLSNYTNEETDNYHNSDVNVAIASCITDPRGPNLYEFLQK